MHGRQAVPVNYSAWALGCAVLGGAYGLLADTGKICQEFSASAFNRFFKSQFANGRLHAAIMTPVAEQFSLGKLSLMDSLDALNKNVTTIIYDATTRTTQAIVGKSWDCFSIFKDRLIETCDQANRLALSSINQGISTTQQQAQVALEELCHNVMDKRFVASCVVVGAVIGLLAAVMIECLRLDEKPAAKASSHGATVFGARRASKETKLERELRKLSY